MTIEKKSAKSPLLSALLDDVQAFCKARRGRVAELATALGVAQPQISAWLTRRVEPSGEVTLQISAWLLRERECEDAARVAKIAAVPARLSAALKGAVR